MKKISKLVLINLVSLFCVSLITSCSCSKDDETILIVGTTASFEKATYDDYNFSVFSRTLSNLTPISINQNNEYVSLLCDFETNVVDNKLETVFSIKDNAKWSDETRVSADDFIFTIDYLKEQSPSFTLHKQLESYEVVDNNKVKVVFKEANYTQLDNITSFTLLPKHVFNGKVLSSVDSSTSIGNGPYKFESKNDENNTLTFVKTNNSLLEGKYNKVIFKTYSNMDTLSLALRNNEINVIYNYSSSIDPTIAETFKNNENISVYTHSQTNNPYLLFFNQNNPKLQNQKLRQAISYAIDYESFYKTHGSEFASSGNRGIIAPGNLGYKDTDKLTKNLDKAHELMLEAGLTKLDDGYYKDGNKLSLTITTRNDGTAVKFTRAGETIQNQLKEFGIDVNLDPKTTLQEFQAATGKKSTTYELCISSATSAGVKFDHGMLTRYLYGPLSHNAQVGNINDQDYLDLIDKLDKSGSVSEFVSNCHLVQDYYALTTPAIALMYDQQISLFNKSYQVKSFDPQLGILNVYNLSK